MAILGLGLSSAECCDDDLRPLLVSWSVSLVAAAAWLLVVHLTPAALIVPTTGEPAGPLVTIDPAFGARPAAATSAPSTPSSGGTSVRRAAAGLADFAGIFAAAISQRAFKEVTHAIPGVQAVQADVGPEAAHGGKTALTTTARDYTPGRTSLGAQGRTDAAALGQVRQGAQVDRSEFHARPLAAVSAPAITGQLVDASELGAFVRGRVAQLQSCYEQSGGTDLAGVVALRLTVGAGGAVESAEIVRRSWSGPAAAAAEACLLRVARGWRLPGGDAGATVTLPISFTRGT